MFYPQETIRKKRDKELLSHVEIKAFCRGIAQNTVTEGQIAAFAMAVYLNGMNLDERIALTLAMRDSGTVLQWHSMDLSGPVLDKHSTGGVGDGVSLVLGPMLAACGAHVPMISGRSLGHTGGTLDKLDSIPGYNITPDRSLFQQTVRDIGIAIIGQTADLAPTDARLYATRDVTATVESLDLITSSILSKKLAAGLQGLVMDVKVGDGAFMPSYEASKQLATTIVDVAKGSGLPAAAVLTNMDQPLAPSAGNALEIAHATQCLQGERKDSRFHQVVLALGEPLLIIGKLAESPTQARVLLNESLTSGRALECFAKMIAALGGPINFIENTAKHLPKAAIVRPVHTSAPGVVQKIQTRDMGMAVVGLGGGRRVAKDHIDPSVGLSQIAGLGAWVDAHVPLAVIHAQDEDTWQLAAKQVQEAYAIAERPLDWEPALIHEHLIRA